LKPIITIFLALFLSSSVFAAEPAETPECTPCAPVEGAAPPPPTAEEINDKIFALGGGVGVSTSLFVSASVMLKWVSLDASWGLLLVGGWALNSTYGVTGRMPLMGESLAGLLTVSAGRDWAVIRTCLEDGTGDCGPPNVENTVEAALGVGYRWPNFDLRALFGAKYRWGKTKNETRSPVDEPYTPVVNVIALWRFW